MLNLWCLSLMASVSSLIPQGGAVDGLAQSEFADACLPVSRGIPWSAFFQWIHQANYTLTITILYLYTYISPWNSGSKNRLEKQHFLRWVTIFSCDKSQKSTSWIWWFSHTIPSVGEGPVASAQLGDDGCWFLVTQTGNDGLSLRTGKSPCSIGIQ